MEGFEGDGTRRELSPGEVGRIDQKAAAFRDLRDALIGIRNEVAAILATRDPQSGDKVKTINEDLFTILGNAFKQDMVFGTYSFIMFLIDEVASGQARMNLIRERVEKSGDHISDALTIVADALDLCEGGPGGNPSPRYPQGPGLQPDGTFVTGIGQVLDNIHAPIDCVGWCVIHRPLPGPWQDWPTVWRGDEPWDIWRGFERNCPHGKGHRAVEEILMGLDAYPHGCCGICKCSPASARPVFHHDTGELIGYE